MELHEHPLAHTRKDQYQWMPAPMMAPVILVALQPDRRQGPVDRRLGPGRGGRRAEDRAPGTGGVGPLFE